MHTIKSEEHNNFLPSPEIRLLKQHSMIGDQNLDLKSIIHIFLIALTFAFYSVCNEPRHTTRSSTEKLELLSTLLIQILISCIGNNFPKRSNKHMVEYRKSQFLNKTGWY